MLPALAIFTALSLAAVPAAAQRHDHDPTPAPHADESTRVRRVSLATGVALDVAERGRRDGKPVLFLHGYTDSRVSFARVLPALPAGIRAIVPSMRGHGDSERPECCYRPTDFAADAVALLDALGIPRATIVGHSLGSFIAQRIALEYPERVDRLVLVGSGYSPRVAAAVEFLQVVNALQDPVPAELIRDFQQSTLFAPVSAEFFSKILGESGKLPARVWRDVLNALLQHEGMGDLGRIRSPTLVVWGDQDQYWTRDQQEGLLRLIPGARLLVYEKIGHAPNWEAPGRFAADVVRFLEGPVPVARRDEGGTPDVVKVERIRHSRVRLRTGVELDVAQRGRSDGEPVLFLHGFTDSWYSFTPMLEQLPPAIRAIVPSQRGHGDSERPACCYLIRDFARDAVALLDALGIGQAVVVGHSNGSFAAQRIAIDHPERVKRLVLVGSAARPGSKPMRELNAFVQTLRDPVDPAFVREFQVSTIFKPVPPAYLDRVVEESYKLPARVWRDALAGLLSDTATGELDRIRSSTLVVWGAHDGLFARSDQDALVGAIRGAQFVGYPDLGHAVHWEDPARFIADLVKFLELPEQGAIPSGRPDTPMPPRGEPHAHGAAAPPGPMPLLAGLGDWSLRVTTGSAEAQRYFDQGLRLMYAFNHDEAVRSFERAVELDATCALCHWGIAYALGPNINLPMDAAAEPRALAAARAAARLKGRVTPHERALIESMVLRYGEPAGAARAARDSAYATAMRAVARRFPDDADVQVIFADAMLNLRPWNQWTRDGRPQPGTEAVVATLERTLRRTPDHAGACHFYIHAIEASATPERALPCAERLPRLMPGAGHVVHMPAHVYLRVGRYEDAARANIAAVEADGRYFGARDVPEGMYPMFYAPHNLHFLWSTYLLSGQRAKALSTARALAERVRLADARTVPSLEGFLVSEVLTLARFGDWDSVLAAPAPPAELRYVTGMWHYARGLARAARGEIAAATAALDSVRAIASRVPDDMIIILNPAPALLTLAAEVLAGRIAGHQQQHAAAIAHFRAAARMEDALTYDEPPPWYHSARNFLGVALLDAGRHVEAEAAFRDDLRFVRETGWSLAGLERALRAQGKMREAAQIATRLRKAWEHADGPTFRGR